MEHFNDTIHLKITHLFLCRRNELVGGNFPSTAKPILSKPRCRTSVKIKYTPSQEIVHVRFKCFLCNKSIIPPDSFRWCSLIQLVLLDWFFFLCITYNHVGLKTRLIFPSTFTTSGFLPAYQLMPGPARPTILIDISHITPIRRAGSFLFLSRNTPTRTLHHL